MINYKFIKHGSVQSYDTTITLNSLQQQRESTHDLRERMGGSYAPAEKKGQQTQMSIGCITLCSGKENPWQNSEIKNESV